MVGLFRLEYIRFIYIFLLIDFQIVEVKFAVIPTNRTTRDAYVLFAKHENIEKALPLDRCGINDVPAEIYRSSTAQMQFYTTIPSKRQKSVNAASTNISTEKISKALESEGESVQLVKGVDSTANGIISEL